MIRLSQSIGDRIGWLGYSAGTFNARLTSAGYPGDKRAMWAQSFNGVDTNAADKLFLSTQDSDVMGGQSGSSVWLQGSTGPIVRAVCSFDCRSCGSCSGRSCPANGFVQLDTQHFNSISSWR